MYEVPTPAWIASQGLGGPTHVVTTVPPFQASAFAGVPMLLLALLGALTRSYYFAIVMTILAVPVTIAVAYVTSKFRFLAGEDWLAAEYLMHKRLVRLDDIVKASVSSGSYTYLTLRDSRGGNVSIQVTATLPKVRPQIIRGITEGLQRGLKVNQSTLDTLGIRIQRV